MKLIPDEREYTKNPRPEPQKEIANPTELTAQHKRNG